MKKCTCNIHSQASWLVSLFSVLHILCTCVTFGSGVKIVGIGHFFLITKQTHCYISLHLITEYVGICKQYQNIQIVIIFILTAEVALNILYLFWSIYYVVVVYIYICIGAALYNPWHDCRPSYIRCAEWSAGEY